MMASTGQNDRREFVRIDFSTPVSLQAGGLVLRGETAVNLSMGGLRIPFAGPAFQEGTPCQASVLLKAFDRRVTIEAQGRVTPSEPGSLSVQFLELDPDSYNHLRKLILANAPDPARAEQEFEAHWGIRKRGFAKAERPSAR